MQGETYKALLKNRIGGVSLALRDVADTTRRVNERLSGMVSGDLSSVYNAAADRVCRKCKNRSVCWQLKYTDTCNVLNDALGVLRRGEDAGAQRRSPAYFSKSCMLPPRAFDPDEPALPGIYRAGEHAAQGVAGARGGDRPVRGDGADDRRDGARPRRAGHAGRHDGGQGAGVPPVAERLSRPRDLHGGRRREHDAGGHGPHLQALAARPDRADGVTVGHLRAGFRPARLQKPDRLRGDGDDLHREGGLHGQVGRDPAGEPAVRGCAGTATAMSTAGAAG